VRTSAAMYFVKCKVADVVLQEHPRMHPQDPHDIRRERGICGPFQLGLAVHGNTCELSGRQTTQMEGGLGMNLWI
jgi:hypothetical protein